MNKDILKHMGLGAWDVTDLDYKLVKWYFHCYIQIQCLSYGPNIVNDVNLRKIFHDKLIGLEDLKPDYAREVNCFDDFGPNYSRDEARLSSMYNDLFEVNLNTSRKNCQTQEYIKLFSFLSDLAGEMKSAQDNGSFYEKLNEFRQKWIEAGLMELSDYVIPDFSKVIIKTQLSQINFEDGSYTIMENDMYFELRGDISADYLFINGNNIVLDLNGYLFRVKYVKCHGTDILIKNGKIESNYAHLPPIPDDNPRGHISVYYSENSTKIGLCNLKIIVYHDGSQQFSYFRLEYVDAIQYSVKDCSFNSRKVQMIAES